MRPNWQEFNRDVAIAAKRYQIPNATIDDIAEQISQDAAEHGRQVFPAPLCAGGQGRAGQDIQSGAIGCALMAALLWIIGVCAWMITHFWPFIVKGF